MYTTEVVRVVAAAPIALYAALVDPYAIARWRVPDDMHADVLDVDRDDDHVMGFRMALVYPSGSGAGKSDEQRDVYRSRFVERVPGVRVVERIEFESSDPTLRTAMTLTTTLRAADDGTEVAVVHDGIPDVIPRHDNEVGTRMALDRLALLVEAR